MGLQSSELSKALKTRRLPDIRSTSVESLNQHKLHQKQRERKNRSNFTEN
ncbi:hypothetical protein ACL6C3_14420 [Capilliphycus salinus ALCB114379]